MISMTDNITDGIFSLLNYTSNDSSIIAIETVTGEYLLGETVVVGYITPFEGPQSIAE